MMHWEGIVEFVTVVETQSFTVAAQRLGVSVAQVSRQISALEEYLGVALFNRIKKRVTLSEAGDQTVVRPVDSEVDKMVDALLKAATGEEGEA